MILNDSSSSLIGVPVADDNHKYFDQLRRVGIELIRSLRHKTPISADQLKIIRSHIQFCDSLEKRRFETYILLIAAKNWRKCYYRWLWNKPQGDEDVELSDIVIKTTKESDLKNPQKSQITTLAKVEKPLPESTEPKKKWEEVLTVDDLKFLKSMRFSKDDRIRNPEKEDDGA